MLQYNCSCIDVADDATSVTYGIVINPIVSATTIGFIISRRFV